MEEVYFSFRSGSKKIFAKCQEEKKFKKSDFLVFLLKTYLTLHFKVLYFISYGIAK
jgi:hypothetical protein